MRILLVSDIHANWPALAATVIRSDSPSTAIGISASKFRALVEDGRMPSPRRIDGRSIWDVDELRAAFKALPHEGECERPIHGRTWRNPAEVCARVP
jgi:predicted DNA-binding transcriptional regulator AlpA